ncbi:hypothetical protein [Yoonia sp.]|uniref:hypothetical protein n=1 Tax=Yoonia sp. TaxID=2212373 RepID=UPI00391A24D9
MAFMAVSTLHSAGISKAASCAAATKDSANVAAAAVRIVFAYFILLHLVFMDSVEIRIGSTAHATSAVWVTSTRFVARSMSAFAAGSIDWIALLIVLAQPPLPIFQP